MPVYKITDELIFPFPDLAREDGLLGVGGDLSPTRLLLAYENGIFPWFSANDPIMWWSPDPRCIIRPGDIHVSRSLKKFMRKTDFSISADTDFRSVIEACSKVPRKEEGGTWIGKEMVEAYCELHHLGMAHSIEFWHEKKLVGGMYGISIGASFFGESMFSFLPNASKIALLILCRFLERKNFVMLDCQLYNPHLESMGAIEIDRAEFLEMLKESNKIATKRGSWEEEFTCSETLPEILEFHRK